MQGPERAFRSRPGGVAVMVVAQAGPVALETVQSGWSLGILKTETTGASAMGGLRGL